MVIIQIVVIVSDRTVTVQIESRGTAVAVGKTYNGILIAVLTIYQIQERVDRGVVVYCQRIRREIECNGLVRPARVVRTDIDIVAIPIGKGQAAARVSGGRGREDLRAINISRASPGPVIVT
jgi:hypothetical protein